LGNSINLIRYRNPNAIQQYWRHPWDDANSPVAYLEGAARSQFLVELVKKYAKPNARILEIGCNVGRNLNYLFLAGFKDLSGVEISESAVQLLKQSFPEMAGHSNVYNEPIEERIRHFGDDEFSIVFTMAVLEHIPTESEWVFPEIVRIAKGRIITIEDEGGKSWRHFPRNYRQVFETLGMRQIEEICCNEIDGLDDRRDQFYARVFAKR
jgi:SAM-dependent methyltransferase